MPTFSRLARICLTTCSLLFVLGSVPSSQAQVGLVSTAALALTGRQIMTQAQQLVNQKLADINNIASGLVNQGITSLNVSIEAARINASAVLDKPLRELKEGERTIFLGIYDATAHLDEAVQKAYRLEEVTNVDITNRLGDILGISRSTFISSVGGLSVLKGRQEYRVMVIGTGLGPGQSGVSARVELLMNDTVVPTTRVDSSGHNTAVLYLPPSVFEPHFRSDRVATLPLHVRLTVKRETWWGMSSETKVVNAPVLFSLYPVYAGHARVVAEVPTFEWVTTMTGQRQGFLQRDCGGGQCGGGGVYEEKYTTPVPGGNTPVVGHQRVTNVKCECGPEWWAPDACRYSYKRVCEAATTDTQVHIAWQQTGVWGHWYGVWDVQEYRRTGTTPIAQELDVFYTGNISFCLPDTVDFFQVRLNTVTKENFDLTPQLSQPGRFEYLGSFSCRANEKRYEYRVVAPTV